MRIFAGAKGKTMTDPKYIEQAKKILPEERTTKSSWLTFCKLDFPDKKTEVWQVISVKGVFLGDIKWFGRWRQYAFFPEENTVFNRQCLQDIYMFTARLMNDWKASKKR